MKVNYVLMYGTPYLKYKEFEAFEDVSKFLINKCIVNYSIFRKLEDKEEIEMIYRDNDIHYLENIIKEIRELAMIKKAIVENEEDYSKCYLEGYENAIQTQHLSHSGVMLEAIKSTIKVTCDDFLKILDKVKEI